MVFQKVVKSPAYMSRFQTKYRRRREGKTDYRARRAMVSQDKNKFNTPRYRLVVRKTNKDVIAQITYAKVTGDVVIAAAYAHELKNYGVVVGHSNYAACYATGLLLARRVLTKLGLAAKYQGQAKADGSDYNVDPGEKGNRPFTACLDVGLARTTTGAGIFSVMKGALDGGLNVPHKPKRFVGGNGDSVDADALRSRIFGGHVSEHMKSLQDEDPEKYQQQYSAYIKAGIKADGIEKMWADCHAGIRSDPNKNKKAKKYGKGKRFKGQPKRITTAQRLENRKIKKAKLAAEAEEED